MTESAPHTKYLFGIAFFAVLSILITFGIYFLNFHGELSADPNNWGIFGDFIGGALNPVLSFFALFALLITISIQSQQLYYSRKELELTKMELAKSAEAAQRQANHFEREATRIDIYRVIQKLSERINSTYNSNNIEPIKGHTNLSSIHATLKGGNDINKNNPLKLAYENYQISDSETHRVIKWLENDLIGLANYVAQYDKETKKKNKYSPFADFYRAEYGEMVQTFTQLNMMRRELYNFYCK